MKKIRGVRTAAKSWSWTFRDEGDERSGVSFLPVIRELGRVIVRTGLSCVGLTGEEVETVSKIHLDARGSDRHVGMACTGGSGQVSCPC